MYCTFKCIGLSLLILALCGLPEQASAQSHLTTTRVTTRPVSSYNGPTLSQGTVANRYPTSPSAQSLQNIWNNTSFGGLSFQGSASLGKAGYSYDTQSGMSVARGPVSAGAGAVSYSYSKNIPTGFPTMGTVAGTYYPKTGNVSGSICYGPGGTISVGKMDLATLALQMCANFNYGSGTTAANSYSNGYSGYGSYPSYNTSSYPSYNTRSTLNSYPSYSTYVGNSYTGNSYPTFQNAIQLGEYMTRISGAGR